ncbi:sugar phosphate isomerase/epimerase [Gracilibacillus sp. YIM 98692]|uniref:sugar phosphate isomerase/epimerase family protein n=1 Tax=Gracilibacillus sp. YIM 98692 TaxID=2663532 RepID=UPI0013D74500|nr:sugar phosphate isomerase/epimerase [Gracilibacillus sp. YIM 98692]
MKFRRIGNQMQMVSNQETSKYPPGLTIFTVREPFSKDYLETLQNVAEMGYKVLELYDYDDIPAKDMKKALNQLGLRAISLFVRNADLEENLRKHLQYAKHIGAEFIVTDAPEVFFQDEEKFQDLVSLLKHAQTVLEKHNIQLVYHPHTAEFKKVNETYWLDRLIKSVDPNLQLELDTYWIKKVGLDPVETLYKYNGHVPLLHIKDINKEGEFKEVGQGILIWPLIFSAAKDIGVKYYFVEQDVTSHPLKSVQMSIDYLRKIGLA